MEDVGFDESEEIKWGSRRKCLLIIFLSDSYITDMTHHFRKPRTQIPEFNLIFFLRFKLQVCGHFVFKFMNLGVFMCV